MGISVFMFCPECAVFLPLGYRDPSGCDVEGSDTSEGAFSLSVQEVMDTFTTNTQFFSTSPYDTRLRTIVRQFAKDHAHAEGAIYCTTNYGVYPWEPRKEEDGWWRYEEIVVMDGDLPNELPSPTWTFLPSYVVRDLGCASFDEALNYLVAQGRIASSLEQARDLVYFRQFYEGVIKWIYDPALGGKEPYHIPPRSTLIEHCLESIRTSQPAQLSALNTMLPDHLAQKVWHTLARTSHTELLQLEELESDFFDLAWQRYQALQETFARSLTRFVITPVVLGVFDCQELINPFIVGVVSHPECALRDFEVTLAGNDWEQDSRESRWPSLCSLRTLTMVLVRCLQPNVERWSLVSCGALTDEFLLPLDTIDEGPFVDELVDKEENPKKAGLRAKDQDQIREVLNRLRDSPATNLRGPYGLEELDVSNCHRLTDRITGQLHQLFPRLTRLHLNDLTFLPFHTSLPPSAGGPRLEHLVELNMAASYYPHEQKRDKAYFAQLSAICPALEALNVAFWSVTDAELDDIVTHFSQLRRINVIGSTELTTEAGLSAVGKHLSSRGRGMDEVNVGGCKKLTGLKGLEMVRYIKTVGAPMPSLWPVYSNANGDWAVEELDLTRNENLKDEQFLALLSGVKTLKRLKINECFSLQKDTVIQAAKDFPKVHIVSGGYYQN